MIQTTRIIAVGALLLWSMTVAAQELVHFPSFEGAVAAGRERHGLILRNIAGLVEEKKFVHFWTKVASRWKQHLTPTAG